MADGSGVRRAGGTVAIQATADVPTDPHDTMQTDAVVDMPAASSCNASEEATTPTEAPAIAGLGKIQSSSPTTPRRKKPPPKPKIIVPQRSCNGGFDFKFETDPYEVRLHDLLSAEEFTVAITRLNETLRPSRSKNVDGVLLATGPLLVPLALWGVRHSRQTELRKKLLKEGIEAFNAGHPDHYMRWNRGRFLSIEPRKAANVPSTTPLPTGLEDSTVMV